MSSGNAKKEARANREKHLLYFLIRVFETLPHRAALRLGAFLGTLLWAFDKRRVDRAEQRCVAALGIGVTTARTIVRRSWANMGRSVAEFARMNRLHPDLASFVSIRNARHLDEALSRGKGVLLMTAHTGNWELAGARLIEAGYPIAPLYTPQRNQNGLEDFLRLRRIETAGMEIIPSEGFGLRDAFRALKEGRILTFLVDLDARKEGILIPFLGMDASTATGIVRLHRKFGAPVVPAVAVREPDGMRHTIHIYEVLSDLRDEDGSPFGVDMVKSLQMCNNIVSNWIRGFPEQWLWLLDRWESVFRGDPR